jgi:hypothetical protein
MHHLRNVAVAVILGMFASACTNYSHVGPSTGTFSRPTPPPLGAGTEVQTGPLVLKIYRHLDTILKGPDSEEDQTLTLKVRDVLLNQKLLVPSDNVTPDFVATRFGPTSKGQGYDGYLILRKITGAKIDAFVHIDVTANTDAGSYTETARYRGKVTFIHNTEDDKSDTSQ